MCFLFAGHPTRSAFMWAKPLDFLREFSHPLPGFFRQAGGFKKTLVHRHLPCPGHQVVGMRHNLLFNRLWHAVAGVKAQCNTFFSGKTGARVAFHNPDNIFRNSSFTQQVRTGLCMGNRVRHASANIMEHGTSLDKDEVGILTAPGIRKSAVSDRFAMQNDLPAAPGTAQQVFTGF